MEKQKITEIEINGSVYVLKDSTTVRPLNDYQIEWNGVVFNRNGNILTADKLNEMPLVMIRSDKSGVHFGYLKDKKEAGDKWNVTLVNSRRVFYWSGAASITQLSLEGTKKPNDCKFTMETPTIEVAGVIEILPITKVAEENLKNVKVWKL